ncbi:MAG: hypothetical protein FJ271_27130 [Planctomycetes bacterium]|nr:hypothetical protein [Planctomycetota bacterium]
MFSATDVEIRPADLLEFLHRHGHEVAAHFCGDDQGWFSAELQLPGEETSLEVQRYLVSEKGIRDELNTWAAWLEMQTSNKHRDDLMRRVVQSQQVFTICSPPEICGDSAADEVCRRTCAFLAQATAGIYQIDDQGFFAADGTHLVPEA